MGCSSSKVKDTATDPSVHSAAAAAIAIAANNSGRPTSDTKQLQKDLRKRVDNVRKRRQKQDALHPEEMDRGRHRHSSSSSSGSDSTSSSSTSSSSEDRRRRRRNRRRRRRRQERQQEDQDDPQQQRELRTQPYQEGIEPLGYGMMSSPRGTLSVSQKQQASNGIAAELSSVHFASPQPPPPLPNRSETLANICTDDLCSPHGGSSSWCPSDRFPAEMAKLAAERDEALRELLYLRTMAAATDGFQDEPRRVPVEWVPSEHRKIEELYRNNVRLHREYGALRHTYRKLLASTTTTSPASHDPRRIHSSSPHHNRTTVPTPVGMPLFPDAQQDHSADLAGVAPPSRPLSPTALAESIHSLHDSYDQLQQRCREAQRTLEDTTQARVAAAEALECTALRLRWEELRAALELTPRLEYAFRGVIGSEEDSARTAVLLEMSKLPSPPPPPSTAAAEEANTNNDTSKSKVIGVLEDEWEMAAKDCGFPARTSPLTVVSMLSQLAQFLIDHKSCPSRTRMELMQTVLEHAGRSVKGIDPIVSDSTSLDFSSCGFGDSLAQLSSIVLSRLNCRVTKLSLSDSGLTDLGLARISMVLAVLPYEVPLSVLNLSSNELSCRSVVQLLTAFMGCGGVGPGKLRHKLLIDLRNNEPILESLESAWAVLQEVEQLKHVNTNVEVLLSPIPKAMLAEVATRHARAGSMIVHAGPPL